MIKPFEEGQTGGDSVGEDDGKEGEDDEVDCANHGTSSHEDVGQANEDEERDHLLLLSANTCL